MASPKNQKEVQIPPTIQDTLKKQIVARGLSKRKIL